MITYSRLGNNGRLGNQLWQIAGTLAVAYDNDTDPVFPAWSYVDDFNVPREWFTGQSGDEASTFFDDVPWRDYLQHYPLIEPYADLMRDVFSPRHPERFEDLRSELRPDLSAAVHVRRGDYAETWRGHGMLSREWYLDNWPSGRVLVFSDDPQWCRDNLPGQMAHFDAVTDLFLMSMCDRLLISNSSFAWWGAFLADAPTRYPDPWFTFALIGDMAVDGWQAVPRAD